MPDLEDRIQAQILEAAQVGFHAQQAAKYQEPSRRWRDLSDARQLELTAAASLVRTSYLQLKHDARLFETAFAACNQHRVLGVTHVFIGAVIGFYIEWGL